MPANADPAEMLSWFTDMRAYWCQAELDALIALVEKARPFSTEMQIARHLAESARRAGQKPN